MFIFDCLACQIMFNGPPPCNSYKMDCIEMLYKQSLLVALNSLDMFALVTGNIFLSFCNYKNIVLNLI